MTFQAGAHSKRNPKYSHVRFMCPSEAFPNINTAPLALPIGIVSITKRERHFPGGFGSADLVFLARLLEGIGKWLIGWKCVSSLLLLAYIHENDMW